MKLLLCIAALIASPALAQDCQPVREYDEIAANVTAKFYDRAFRGLDWQARVAHYRVQVSCRDVASDVAMVVNKLLTELKASHTALYTADDLEYWALQSIFSRNTIDFKVPFVGVWPERRDGGWYAKYVLPGSPAFGQVQVGDKLLSIDGKAFQPLGFKSDVTAALVVSSDGVTTRNIDIQPVAKSLQQFFLDASRESMTVLTVGEQRVGYFRLWSGTHELFLQSLNSALSSFEAAQVDALVLDLRGGFGGASVNYLDKLKETSYLARIPKFFLIDDGVRSGKELLAATIKHQHLGALVGTRTAGAFLGASPVRLFDNKYLLYVAVASWFPPEIGPLEGIGVAPDVMVPTCRELCSNADPQFNTALQLLNYRLSAQSSAQPSPVVAWYRWQYRVDSRLTEVTTCAHAKSGTWVQVGGPFKDDQCAVTGYP